MAIGSLANLDGASFYINEDDMKDKGTFNDFLSRCRHSAHFSSEQSRNTE